MKFKEIYPTFETFKLKVIDPIQAEYPDSDWCDYDKMLTSWEAIYNALYRTYNWRPARYKTQQIHNNLINTFIEELPNFYLKQKAFLKSNLVNFESLTTLGTTDEISRDLQNILQNEGSISSNNQSIISPQGFVNTIDDTVASQVNKDNLETKNTSKSQSSNTGTETTKRVDILEKFIKLLSGNYRYQLKDLILKFQDNFQRFQTIISNGDEDIYIQLKNILKENNNIEYVFDDKTSTIEIDLKATPDLKNDLNIIEQALKDKIDLDFNNAKVNDLVSQEPNNQIKVDNNKLYVKSGGTGETYTGDNKSIKISDKNVISSYGVHITDNEVLIGTDIAEKFENDSKRLDGLGTSINKNTLDIQTNKNNINERLKYNDLDSKSIVKAESGTYYCKALSKPGVSNYWTIDDINTIIDNKIKDAISKIVFPKWKIVLTPDKFNFTNNEFKFSLNIKSTSHYCLYTNKIDGSGWSQDTTFKGIFFGNINSIIFFYDAGQDLTYCIEINKDNNIAEYRGKFLQGNVVLDISNTQFYLLELENATEPIPVSPSTIFSKTEEYNYFKKHLKNYIKGEDD